MGERETIDALDRHFRDELAAEAPRLLLRAEAAEHALDEARAQLAAQGSHLAAALEEAISLRASLAASEAESARRLRLLEAGTKQGDELQAQLAAAQRQVELGRVALEECGREGAKQLAAAQADAADDRRRAQEFNELRHEAQREARLLRGQLAAAGEREERMRNIARLAGELRAQMTRTNGRGYECMCCDMWSLDGSKHADGCEAAEYDAALADAGKGEG